MKFNSNPIISAYLTVLDQITYLVPNSLITGLIH